MSIFTSMKIKKEILEEMQEVKKITGISIYRIFEEAWRCYKHHSDWNLRSKEEK